jgi:hypothetical protein
MTVDHIPDHWPSSGKTLAQGRAHWRRSVRRPESHEHAIFAALGNSGRVTMGPSVEWGVP